MKSHSCLKNSSVLGSNTIHRCGESTNRHQPFAALLLSALVTVGCGSSGSSSDSSSTDAGEMENAPEENTIIPSEDFPVFQGVFRVTERLRGGVRSMNLSARFIQSDTRVYQGHQFLLGEDRCQELLGGTSFAPPELIGAGEVLVVSNQDGTLAQLDEQTENGVTEEYNVAVAPVTTEQTMGMTLDIPGDQYPGLPTLQIQDLDELSGILPELGTEVNAQTVFRWEPSVYPNTVIGLGISSVISCTLEDDGEFVLPEFFQTLLSDTSTASWTMSRSRYVEHIENGAYIEISRSALAPIE